MSILNRFRIGKEKEDFAHVEENIETGIEFRGTNLWILIFAIFIASLGLNVNSNAVIIGAMLVSPLMGPIMGLGFGMAVNDLVLLRKSFVAYFFAAGIGLATSTLYFMLSPFDQAQSEILARTSPNIYDVLIALFGGFAGILVTASKLKGNVIPGVAIATALMPPLCTAGYGLANLNADFFLGALYLFIINTVFIALATLITIRVLRFPYKHLPQRKDEVRAKRIVWAIVLITVMPSIYFGYDIYQQNKFNTIAEKFVDLEAVFPNDYLLKKTIDPKKRTISLVFGGAPIEKHKIRELRGKLSNYGIADASLVVKQGFAYLRDNEKQDDQITMVLKEKEKNLIYLQAKMDSIDKQQELGKQLFRELKTQFNDLESFSIQPAVSYSDSTKTYLYLGFIATKSILKPDQRKKIENWLKVRINSTQVKLKFEE
ncbi:MAG: DUF389 domain-containing protein [Bacteroidota bacterium]